MELGYLRMELCRFTHLSDDTAVAKMGHPVLRFGCGGLEVGDDGLRDRREPFCGPAIHLLSLGNRVLR